MELKPKIAIVLATYNPNEKYFREQIQSLQKQSFSSWVCIISDDNSKKDSFEFISSLIKDDPRFNLVLNKSQKGSYGNFQNGLLNVGDDVEFVAFCDQDDVWEENKLEACVGLFKDPQVLVVHTDLSLIDKKGSLIHPSCWKKEERDFLDQDFYTLFLRNNVTGCSMMFRRELLNLALPFPQQNPSELSFHHDHWIALIACMKGKIARVDAPLIRYRQHDQNVVGAAIKEKKTLWKKLSNLKLIFKKSAKAYKQRQELYSALILRFPESQPQLEKWQIGSKFLFDILKRALIKPPMKRVALQLVIGRLWKLFKG